MSTYAHRIVITRGSGLYGRAIKEVTVYDVDGNELCKLPITGYAERQDVEAPGKTALYFWSDRVRVENVVDQPTEEMEAIA